MHLKIIFVRTEWVAITPKKATISQTGWEVISPRTANTFNRITWVDITRQAGIICTMVVAVISIRKAVIICRTEMGAISRLMAGIFSPMGWAVGTLINNKEITN